jgi:hypothetical protein
MNLAVRFVADTVNLRSNAMILFATDHLQRREITVRYIAARKRNPIFW